MEAILREQVRITTLFLFHRGVVMRFNGNKILSWTRPVPYIDNSPIVEIFRDVQFLTEYL